MYYNLLLLPPSLHRHPYLDFFRSQLTMSSVYALCWQLKRQHYFFGAHALSFTISEVLQLRRSYRNLTPHYILCSTSPIFAYMLLVIVHYTPMTNYSSEAMSWMLLEVCFVTSLFWTGFLYPRAEAERGLTLWYWNIPQMTTTTIAVSYQWVITPKIHVHAVLEIEGLGYAELELESQPLRILIAVSATYMICTVTKTWSTPACTSFQVT